MSEEQHFIADIVQKAILQYQDKVLIVMCDGGFWELSGGRLNIGEDPREGLKREIKEELTIDVEPLEVLDVMSFISPSTNKHFLVIYLCQPLVSIDEVKSGDGEVIDMRWITEAELDSIPNIRPQYKNALQKFFKSQK